MAWNDYVKKVMNKPLMSNGALNRDQFQAMMGLNKPEPVTSLVASGLNAIKQPLDYYAIDNRVPLVGGQSIADLIGLTGTQSLVQDFSQGKPMMRDGLPDERFIDAASMIPMIKPAAIGTGKAAKYLGKEALRQGYEGTGVLGKIAPDIKMSALPPEKYVGKTLKDMPIMIDMGGGRLEPFGTDQRIVDIAGQYAADRGLVYKPQTNYVPVDEVRAKKIAAAYDKMQNNPSDKKVKKAYDALIEETQAQYEALKKAGYNFEFMPEGADVYGNPRNAINDIVTNKHMFVFPTESGFGSLTPAQASNPLLIKTGEKWGGKDVTANDLFRAVHDVFGHSKHGVGFRATGEENAYQSHAKMYSPEALPAATSETRGQNSWLNFGPYGNRNKKAKTEDTIFADQKAGLLPDWVWREGLLD